MRLQYGLSSYERAAGDPPGLPLVNMRVEEAPTEEGQVALISRPGLSDRSADMGSGPVRAVFKRDLVLSGALFGVSGGNLYSGTTSLGAIGGPGHVSMAGNEIGLMTTAGASLYYYNGTSLATVSFPDSANVAHIETGGSRFWAVRADTGKLYWTDPLEADVEALDFLTAESLPDRLLQTLWIDGGLIGFGKESIEFFQQTGNSALPITPLTNLVIEKGIRATGCATALGHTFAAVTNENTVIVENERNIISNPGLQARIEASAEVSLFTYLLDGEEFLGLRLDTETQSFNPRTGKWHEEASAGFDNWRPQCWAGDVFGCSDGKTAAWGTGHEDFGGTLERRFRAGGWLAIGTIISNLILRCQVGQTPFLTGDYTAPEVEMRISLDNGRTWGIWRGRSLGAQGEYSVSPVWRALGMLRRWKGFLVEFRVTAPVDWRVSDVLVNEPVGGR